MNGDSLDPTVEEVMQDRSASEWLKGALRTALERDPVDALSDAFVLAAVLENQVRETLGLQDPR